MLEFEVSVDRERTARSGRVGSEIPADAAWSAEQLALAALVRCTLASLDYHLRRRGLTAVGSGEAHGVVTRRESDGLYAFVEIEAWYDVQFDDPPEARVLHELVESAERGCFVGNSLAVKPRYRWTVNGNGVQ